MPHLLGVLHVVCTVVGAVTLWTVAVGALASAVVRGVKRRGAPDGAGAAAPLGPRADRRAAQWPAVPAWVARDPAWAVSTLLLGCPLLAERTLPHVDFAARRIDWPALLAAARSWDAAEARLAGLAYELAGPPAGRRSEDEPLPTTPVTVAELVHDLSVPELDLVTAAVDLGRGRCTLAEARARGAAA